MIDESFEELASLYVLDLLEGLEKQGFETLMARDAEVRKLVAELREAAAPLALTTPPVAPPPELKARLLAEIAAPQSQSRAPKAKVIAFPTWIPWAAAAGFAAALAWTGQLYFASRTDASSTRTELTLANLQLKNAQQQLEAERIVTRQQIAGLNQQVADTARLLADLRQGSGTTEQRLASALQQLANANRQLDDAARHVAQLTEQLDGSTKLATNSKRREDALEQSLISAREEVAALEEKIKTEGDLANLRIAKLASMLKNSPQALAVAVWNPRTQEGILQVEKLRPLRRGKIYQLWLVDPQYPNPVDGGVFTVDPKSGEQRVRFKAGQPVQSVAAFAVTLERKGGVPKAEGPFVLLGQNPKQ